MNTRRMFLILGGVVALGLAFSARGFAAPPSTVSQSCGTARMSVSDGASCIQDSLNSNGGFATGVESWDIEHDKTYTVTLTGITECAPDGNSEIGVIVRNSNTGNQCLQAGNCSSCGVGCYTCTFTVKLDDAPLVVSGDAGACFTYPVSYCTSNCNTSTGTFAQRSDGLPTRSGGCQQSHLRASDFSDTSSPPACGTATEDEDCSAEHREGCVNSPGGSCCTLSQGCFGAWNSQCNCTGESCNPVTDGTGYITANPACLPESADGVTIVNQTTLISELPASGQAGQITSPGSYDCASGAPSCGLPGWSGQGSDPNQGGTNGQGGGALTGHTLSLNLSACLGDAAAFVQPSSGLGSFVLPTTGTLLCTKRSGEDKLPDTGDEVCEAFAFPACVSGLTVAQVQACADEFLSTGADSCGCSKSDMTAAMGAIIRTFDSCGTVIACPDDATAGVLDCGTLASVAAAAGRCGAADADAVANVLANANNACVGNNPATHGAYVSCVRAQVRSAIRADSLRRACSVKAGSCAARSTYGTSRVACWRTNANAVTRCSIKRDAAHCTAPAGGSASSRTNASCCDAP